MPLCAEEPRSDAETEKERRSSAWIAACLTVIIVYSVLIAKFEFWGLVLGWIPTAPAALLTGYIAYRIPWLGALFLGMLYLLGSLLAALTA